MDKISNETLIKRVEERPAIWDMKCSAYRDRQKKKQAWEEITKSFFKESVTAEEEIKLGEALQVRWKNLRDRYARAVKSMKAAKPVSGRPRKCPYIYRRQLAFLADVLELKASSFARKPQESEHILPEPVALETSAIAIPSPSSSNQNSHNSCMNGSQLNSLKANIISALEEITSARKQEHTSDDDLHFLLSLHPTMNIIPQHLKMASRLEIMQVVMKYASSSALTQLQPPANKQLIPLIFRTQTQISDVKSANEYIEEDCHQTISSLERNS